jgi:RNA polymerase sigma-70 factor (ECF subfamily)
MQQNTVNQLLRDCQKGNRSAQYDLYQGYYGFAFSIVSRYANGENDTKEIIQDVFLKVFNNLKNYNFDYPFEPWFKKIIIRTCIDRYRANLRKIETVELDYAVNEDYVPEFLINADAQYLLDLVQKLSPAYRTTFSMYALDGYEYHEIAELLNISIGSVKSNISKARGYLKQWILAEKENERAGK